MGTKGTEKSNRKEKEGEHEDNSKAQRALYSSIMCRDERTLLLVVFHQHPVDGGGCVL